jgi:hypothetical protein
MKKIVLILSLLFCGFFGYSQSYYIATKSELYTYNLNNEEWDLYQKNSDVNITIVLEDDFLSIQANSPTMYKLARGRGKEISGKSYTGFRYDALNLKKNEICTIDIVKFDETNFMVSIFKTGEYNFRYYIKTK